MTVPLDWGDGKPEPIREGVLWANVYLEQTRVFQAGGILL